jgi:hypothetical protein
MQNGSDARRDRHKVLQITVSASTGSREQGCPSILLSDAGSTGCQHDVDMRDGLSEAGEVDAVGLGYSFDRASDDG